MKIIITENQFVNYIVRRHDNIKEIIISNMHQIDPCDYENEFYEYYVEVRGETTDELIKKLGWDFEVHYDKIVNFLDKTENQIFDFYHNMIQKYYNKKIEEGC